MRKANVGYSWYVEGGRIEGKISLGRTSTVWDGEISGIGRAVTEALINNILILSNSQAAIVAVRKLGKTGSDRTQQLRQVLVDIKY